MTGDLIEFLRARLDDDCAVIADPSVPGNESCQLSNGPRREYWSKERALAEVDAKRRLIHRILRYEAKIDGEWGCGHDPIHIASGQCPETAVNDIEALRLLALPYAGHPDYRPEWAPQ